MREGGRYDVHLSTIGDQWELTHLYRERKDQGFLTEPLKEVIGNSMTFFFSYFPEDATTEVL